MALGLTILLAGSISMVALANPSESELNNRLTEQQTELNNQKENLENQEALLEEAEKELEELQSKIERYNSVIESKIQEIRGTEEKIANVQQEIKESQEKIEQIKIKIQEEEKMFNNRVRQMYIEGNTPYIEIALNSNNFSDLLSRVDFVKSIMDYDNKLLASMDSNEKEFENAKLTQEEQKTSLHQLKNQQVSEKENLELAKNEQLDLMDKTNERKNYYARNIESYNSKIEEEQRMIDETMELIAVATADVPAYNPSRGAVDITSNAVVAFATNYLGAPYVWGAEGPDTFDCSGFVQYVFAHFGVDLYRVTYDQCNQGAYVDRSELQPGDLVFFGYGQADHVGIYVGNNHYIHAPQPGEYIKISPLTRSDFYTARRVF